MGLEIKSRTSFELLLAIFIESFVFEQHVLFRVDFLCVTSNPRVHCPRVGLEVKILDIFAFVYFSFMDLFKFEDNILSMVDFCL